MKLSTRQLFLSAAIAFCFTLALATFAEDTPPPAPSTPAPEAEKSAPATNTPPAEQPAAAAPVATPAAEPAATTTVTAVPAEPAKSEAAPKEEPKEEPKQEPKLRRLDVPSSDEQSNTTTPRRTKRTRVHYNHGNEVIRVFGNATLEKGQKSDAVVAIFGSATSEGEVQDAVVSIFGNTRATGSVGDAAVAVFGNTHVTGSVGDAAIAVFGNTYVNSKVSGPVVAVFGTVELGPDAEVGDDVVAVGGTVKRDVKAIVRGQINNVSFGGAFSDMTWLHSWFENCLLYGRLLAFGPNLMWAWWIAIGFLIFYLLLALLFGKGVDKCAETLEQKPGYSILAALLTVLLAPVVTIILAITGVGIAVIPFLAAGLFFAGFFGKAVMLCWLGRRITRLAGIEGTVLAVLIGGVIVMGLYSVPVLGLIVYKLLGWIGLGVVVYTLIGNMKRERRPAPSSGSTPPMAPTDPALALAVPGTAIPPVMIAATLPRAGFWIRMAALVIDAILVGMVLALFRSSGKMELLALAAYGACMWKLRGSTIGGIICGLKVVRLDDRELDWSTAIVRALGCFLSLIVLGFGFIWVAFDSQKQSWHDKIAGTTVVHVPKGVSLV